MKVNMRSGRGQKPTTAQVPQTEAARQWGQKPAKQQPNAFRGALSLGVASLLQSYERTLEAVSWGKERPIEAVVANKGNTAVRKAS